MTGHDTIKQLREMEQKATPAKWARGKFERTCIANENGEGLVVLRYTNGGELPGAQDSDMIINLRNNADLLLSIAEAFQPGDANGLELLIRWLDAMQKESDFAISPHLMQILVRLQAAAERLER